MVLGGSGQPLSTCIGIDEMAIRAIQIGQGASSASHVSYCQRIARIKMAKAKSYSPFSVSSCISSSSSESIGSANAGDWLRFPSWSFKRLIVPELDGRESASGAALFRDTGFDRSIKVGLQPSIHCQHSAQQLNYLTDLDCSQASAISSSALFRRIDPSLAGSLQLGHFFWTSREDRMHY